MRSMHWIAATFAAAAFGAQAQAPAGDAARGKSLYMKNMCYTCHGTVGQGTVHLKITEVSTEGGTLPSVLSGLVGSIKQSLSVDIKIPPLPYNIQIHDVKASEHGLAVSGAAANVPLSGGRAGS